MKLSGDEINIINELQERYPSMKNCDDLIGALLSEIQLMTNMLSYFAMSEENRKTIFNYITK